MKKVRRFFLNAIFLCAVSMLMRTVGVSFNVYVSNKAGAEAMGLYSLLSGVYGFALTFATSGINLATMRLVAGRLGKEDKSGASGALLRCIIYALSFSAVATAVTFFGAEFISTKLIKDTRTLLSLKILSITLIPISLSSVFNGYFTAVRRVYKNAIIQICEQAIKIFSVSQLLGLMIPRGIEFACAGLALGGAVSECASFLISAICFWIDKRRAIGSWKSKSDKKLTAELLGTALPIASSAYVRSGLISLEHMMIPTGLEKHGASKSHALALFGIIQSMVLPIILFPSALISSFSGLLVPELTECAAKENKRQIRYICERSLHLVWLFAIGVSGIMICFSSELGSVIYPGEKTSLYIRMLAPLIPIMYIDTTVDHMLKGLGEQLYSMIVNIGDSMLSVILVGILLPKIGIMGYIVTIYVTELINAAFSIVRLIRKSGLISNSFKWIIKPLFCIIGATCLCNITFDYIRFIGTSSGFCLAMHIILCTAIYSILLFMIGALDKDDSKWLFTIFAPERSIKSYACNDPA